MQSILPSSAVLCCHPVQWNAATQCNVMLPRRVQSIIHAEGVEAGVGVSER